MSGEPVPECTALARAAATGAQACDQTGAFPVAAFDALRDLGATARPPLDDGDGASLLRILAAVGRGDLSVGRILEGHYNALFLIRRFGTGEQVRHFQAEADAGRLLGVWNTDQPDRPLRLENNRFTGAKAFATGIDGLSGAIVTTDAPAGREMFVVPLATLQVDRSWWKPLGMRASGSHVVDFTGLELQPEWRLGRAGDYVAQPWFSAGAMRFLAVQTGGAHAVLDLAVEHLNRTGRNADPYQAHRLGEMASAVETAYLWLDRCAASWSVAGRGSAASDEAMATVNAARGVVEATAMRVLELAERGLGAAGLVAPHGLERRIRDLRTYLRQPNPDGALAAFGAAVADARWSPGQVPGPASCPH
ncbi:acyl-CoA dehydrogenase family protein [Brevundimonas sp. R86498]|uniref:acyl-CoA dehydrogenase family protein n=1 Tax=Brevundimonas sp. R86498 TaxID=3093845 RepID=UPI0037CB4A6E